MKTAMKLKSVVPDTYPGASGVDVQQLVDFIEKYRPVVLSGAGLSTASGIPDYRSPNGSYSKGHKPATHQEFVSSHKVRQRYWARSVFGFQYLAHAKPNQGHLALASLQKQGFLQSIITQNVDRLHLKAQKVIDDTKSTPACELHGHGDGVHCLSCAKEFSRAWYTNYLQSSNLCWLENVTQAENKLMRADGDAEIKADFDSFQIPACPSCNVGVLMPTIVFFGGSIPSNVKLDAEARVQNGTGLLIVGSSVHVGSAYRLAYKASQKKMPIGIINIGDTRADNLEAVSLRLHCRAADALHEAAQHLVQDYDTEVTPRA